MGIQSVIVADDDAALRQSLAEILTADGYFVRTAESGADALQKFEEAPSDLVVTDIFMPDMDGLELVLSLRRIDESVRILAMSGDNSNADYLHAAAEFGAACVLSKPFRGATFLAAVRNTLDGD